MSGFRFIHAADIHLDSPLRGLARREGAAVDRIRLATREAFDNLVSLALEEEVNFMVIAGDLYDGDWRDFQTGLYFSHQMGRLAEGGVKVFLLYGNHDSESQITKSLVLPDNVNVFEARRPSTFKVQELRVALHGQSFPQRDVSDNLVADYPDPSDAMFNIGVLHTGLGGLGGHENYAPCTLAELIAKGYDYWALGHVHNHQLLHECPHVVFSGNLQGRHIREAGSKGACLVTVEDTQVTELSQVCCDTVRWMSLEVGVDECEEIALVVDHMQRALEAAVRDGAKDRLLACRIELTGRSRLHGDLLGCREQLLAEAQSVALGMGEGAAWIEKVVISTRPPILTRDTASDGDGLSDLRRMFREAANDDNFLLELQQVMGEFVRKLPPDLRNNIDDPLLKASVAGEFEVLLAEVTEHLDARLSARGDE